MTIMQSATEGIEHERVVIRQDPAIGLRLVIAVHSTVLGPALGGMRLRAYPGGLPEALEDVLGLARTMTLKASAAGLDLGGGKAVMLDDGRAESPRRAVARRRRRRLTSSRGAYITAEDIGTTTADIDLMSRHTQLGRRPLGRERRARRPVARHGGDRHARDAARARDGDRVAGSRRPDRRRDRGRQGRRVAGAEARARGRARVRVRRRRRAASTELADEGVVEPAPSAEALLARELDVLAPCAAGGAVDEHVGCRVVCGAANNPLASPEVAERLACARRPLRA